VRAAIPSLQAVGGGAIVFVNAPALRDPAAAHGADAAASGALLTAAQALARELGPSNIRVNSIVPRPLSHAARVAPTAATRASDAAADATVFLASDVVLVILTTAALGFLGLGVRPPAPEWGLMISDGRMFLYNGWWAAAMPGFACMYAGIAFILIGDGLTDLLRIRGQ